MEEVFWDQKTDWLPILEKIADKYPEKEFAGTWVASRPLTYLVKLGLLDKVRSSRQGHRCYYRVADQQKLLQQIQAVKDSLAGNLRRAVDELWCQTPGAPPVRRFVSGAIKLESPDPDDIVITFRQGGKLLAEIPALVFVVREEFVQAVQDLKKMELLGYKLVWYDRAKNKFGETP